MGEISIQLDGDELAHNMMRRGTIQIRDSLRKAASEPVLYQRGLTAFTCRAVVGQTTYNTLGDDGIEIGGHETDFLIDKRYLVDGDEQIEPKPGDIIETQDFGDFEVLPLSGQGCWRYSDAYGMVYRIHAKRVNG